MLQYQIILTRYQINFMMVVYEIPDIKHLSVTNYIIALMTMHYLVTL